MRGCRAIFAGLLALAGAVAAAATAGAQAPLLPDRKPNVEARLLAEKVATEPQAN